MGTLPPGADAVSPSSGNDRLLALETFREALENATDAIGMATPAGLHYYQNPRFTDLFGELKNQVPASAYCDPNVAAEVFRVLQAGGAWNGEVAMRAKDGRVVTVLLRAYANKDKHGNIVSLVGIHTEVSERKRAEETLRQREEQLRALGDNLPDGIIYQIDTGPQGNERRFAYISGGVQNMHEVSAEAVRQDASLIYLQVVEEDRKRVAELEARALQTMTPFHVEVQVRLPSGRLCWRRFSSAPRRLSNGNLIWDGVELDITESRETEAALQQGEGRLRQIIDLVPHFIFAKDVHGRFILVNRAVATAYGTTVEELTGATDADYARSDEEVRHFREDDLAVIRSGTPKIIAEESITDATGKTRFLSTTKYPFTCSGTRLPAVLGVSVDISDLKRAQEAHRRIGMLESLGTVAGGLAHDFNNLLMGVFGNIELAQLDLPDDHPAAVSLKAARQALDNARRLTTRLLTFARGGRPVLETLDLRQSICETVRFHLSGSKVGVHFDLPDDLWPVKADKGQIAEVISNLTVNAREAMTEGGAFHVQARNVADFHDASRPELHGAYVRLTFRDEGTEKIPAHLADRVFEPYFTTKPKGSGLGLAIVHGIVTKHGGHVALESEPGVGTVFYVHLPAGSTVPTKPPAASVPVAACAPRPGGRVLLMDDEEVVRGIASRMIERLGFTVEAVADGREAVARYALARREGMPFDAAILDLTVPGGMGGREAVRELLALDPAARVIVASGYSSDPVLAECTRYGFLAHLAKPFVLQELADALSLAMNRTDRPSA